MRTTIPGAGCKDKSEKQTSVPRNKLIRLINEANMNGNTLELSNINLGDQNMLVLTDELPNYRSITHLSLSNTNITDIGVRRICEVLARTSVVSLDLSRNVITDIGAGYIIRTMRENIFFIKVNLDRKHLSDDVVKILSECIETNNLIQAQINMEKEKAPIYNAVVESVSSALPSELFSLVLDYFNESDIQQARDYLQKEFYLDVISWRYKNRVKEKSANKNKAKDNDHAVAQISGSTLLKTQATIPIKKSESTCTIT
jgi:hypothetical protein